jgi:hypothetical protein
MLFYAITFDTPAADEHATFQLAIDPSTKS